VFEQALDAALSGDSPRRQPETVTTVSQWNLASSLAFSKARFGDASNFTFVFVGSFTSETIKPLVETYLASLPATHARETWRDLGIAPPSGVVEKTIRKGIAPKSSVAIVFSGPFEYDDTTQLAFRTMTQVLQAQLLDTIRQELGGTYSITVSPATAKFPRPEYRVSIEWTCDPARTAALVQRVFDEVERLKATSFSPDQMAMIRQGLLREFERNREDNGYLLNQISRRYQDGDAEHVAAIENLPERIAALTAGPIQRAAQTALDIRRFVKITLTPEAR
jgi:zinc protease